MKTTCRRALALALLLVGAASLVAFALPGFSDRNISAGNLNSADRINVQEIRVTRTSSETVTLSSITVQNLGTAGDGEIDEIIIEAGSTELGSTTSIAGLSTGVTITLGFNMTSTTQDIKVFVVVGTTVSGGETVNLRCKVHYVRDGLSYSSAWISDLTGETIRLGGFDEISDSSPDGGSMNPDDEDVVQRTVFTDNDANTMPVQWAGLTTTEIVRVENLGTAVKTTDILNVKITLTISGIDYRWDSDGDKSDGIDDWGAWNPASPMGFKYEDFWDGALATTTDTNNPPVIPDNGTLTVQVEMKIAGDGVVTDGRTIRTKTTVRVQEQGQDSPEAPVRYDQTSTSESLQTIRKQGFERIEEDSATLGSGTAATGDEVIQMIQAADDDRNVSGLRTTQIYLRNMGTADADEIDKIVVKAGTTTLLTLDNTDVPTGNDILDFRTGRWYALDVTHVVADDAEPVYKIYYTIGTPDDGHTLRPAVRLRAEEPSAGTLYTSDEVTYPVDLGLYEPGFEFVENVTPPEGGTAYSGQRLLAQTIRVEDRDEDDDDVAVHPIVVRNLGTASGNPDITKIEVWRRDAEDGAAVKLGETADLAGLRTGGARVDLTHDNVVQDVASGAIAWLDIYLLIAEPETMVAGRTIQLETRVLHTEKLASFDKMVTSNQWALETNNRPVPNFTFAAAAAGATSIGPKADFTYDQTIQFTGTATDSDSDAITSWSWSFGDGNTASVQNPTHQYPNGGTFTVTLTVTDARGVTGSVSKTIEVEGPPNVAPVIDEITATPQNPALNANVVFAVTITDSDQPAGTAFVYSWEFGDADDSISTLAGPTFSYDTAGAYTVTLIVTDAQGATDTATIDVSVGNDPPVVTGITATPAAKETGDEVALQATGVSDPDDDDIVEYRWNFGDGTSAVTTTATTTHIYGAPDEYTVTVVVEDARGGVSDEAEVTFTVEGPTRVVMRAFPNPAATTATINYFVPTGGTAPELWIFDLNRKQILHQTLAAGDTEFEWDLRTDGGTAVSNGLYFCMITATSAAGQTITSEVFQLLVVR
ncbi:MAG: PKD domain-containing protein [Candidatus Bipolaricaulota bacterium]